MGNSLTMKLSFNYGNIIHDFYYAGIYKDRQIVIKGNEAFFFNNTKCQI